MPLQWTVSHPNRLVIAIAKGSVLAQEMLDLLAGLDAEKARPYRKIIDVTGMAHGFTDKQVQAFAALVRERETETRDVGPLAIVAGTEETLRLARTFAASAEAKRPIQVFGELHLARRWLDGFS